METPVTTQPAVPPARRPHPSRLFVEVTTRCNLRCAMCVKESPGNEVTPGDMSAETFERLAPAFPGLDAMILNGIGEPLLHPLLESFIGRAKRDMPARAWVGFQTNGQLLDRKRADALVAAGVDRVCISADAVTPELFGRLRKGGRSEAVESAFDALAAARGSAGRWVAMGVEFVASRANVHELPELVRRAAQRGVEFVIVTHLLPYHESMASAAAFDTSSDEALKHFRSWALRAAQQGVDLGRYFDVFMQFSPRPEDQRVKDLVGEMTQDAWAKGIELHLDRLLRSDGPLMERVGAAFAEAQEVARARGIDLQLPELAPRRARRCEFVEEGGAFVSWRGDLHPCYFLWHRYRAAVGGVRQEVVPVSHGRVGSEDVLSIWNGPARAFREAVTRYDFPYCHDCGLALCDYMTGESFTQDCYLSTVPCASCLWCTGLFRCLQ